MGSKYIYIYMYTYMYISLILIYFKEPSFRKLLYIIYIYMYIVNYVLATELNTISIGIIGRWCQDLACASINFI